MSTRVLRLLLISIALTPLASASNYSFTLSTVGGESGSGTITSTPNGDGSETVTAISGSITRTYTISNPLPPGSTDPAISLITDNLIFPGAPSLLSAAGGLEFSGQGLGNVILYANGPGAYAQFDTLDQSTYSLSNLQFTFIGPDATVSNASDFTFAYSAGGSLAASGTLWATSNPDGSWTVLGLNGTETLNLSITGLLAPGTFLSNDNLIFPHGTTAVDAAGGLAFSTLGTQETIFSGGNFAPAYDNFSGPSLVDYKVDQFTLTATPEPSVGSLSAAALVGLLLLRRRT